MRRREKKNRTCRKVSGGKMSKREFDWSRYPAEVKKAWEYFNHTGSREKICEILSEQVYTMDPRKLLFVLTFATCDRDQ